MEYDDVAGCYIGSKALLLAQCTEAEDKGTKMPNRKEVAQTRDRKESLADTEAKRSTTCEQEPTSLRIHNG